MAQRVPFIVTALGRNVDPFTLAHLRGARRAGAPDDLAAHSAGLQAAKERGVKLGNPAGRPRIADAAAARDAALRPVLEPMAGLSSRAIAQRLTEQGIEPPRGGAWSQKTVLRMLARLGLKAGA